MDTASDPRTKRPIGIGGAILALLLLLFALHAAVDLGGSGLDGLFSTWVYDALMLGAAASCLLRARAAPTERTAWLLLGAALAIWTAGEIYFEAALANSGSVPVPSPADAGYLLFYPVAYVGLIALARGPERSFGAARWLDGIIVGAAIAALAAALVLRPIFDAQTGTGSTLTDATNLAYPIGDVMLLALVATAAALDGWRLDRRGLVLVCGLVVLGVSDVAYLLQASDGTYVEGGLLDVAWPLGALLIAAAAWIRPSTRRPAGTIEIGGARQIVVPVVAALAALGILAADLVTDVPPGATILALLTLLAVVVRMALAFRENQRSLAAQTREALTDPLTGLGNRRRLMAALEEATTRPREPGELCLMVFFDLDGFKAYNDSFGHPAGDALLHRLGRRLSNFVDARGGLPEHDGAGPDTPHAGAYRLGGDEFCLLVECRAAEVERLVVGATAALGERGDGFLVTASQGSVLIPTEATTREAAMQLADRRMYANKGRERASAGTQSRDVLLSALRETEPGLEEHLAGVADLAVAVADELGVDAELRDEVRRAAELHDVGKIAIPGAILSKPGPLDPAEWGFIRKHTLIGERIIAAAPALVPIARLVRSSHERWDGGGYPDGLAGAAIPLGSRIVFACDAFDAMTSDRPYSVAMLPGRALEEIDRAAGSQFDPQVCAALHSVIERARALTS